MLGFLLGVALCASPPVWADGMHHQQWDRLLKQHVRAGLVDYQGMAADRAQLDEYTSKLAAADLAQFDSPAARLALWINAYNAYVVQAVLDHQPVQSVQDIKGFFDKRRYDVVGESLTLNEIEARGREEGDWRIHFAIVCASTSCPPMRSEAYAAARLNEQLADQTRSFLRHPDYGLRVEGQKLWVSKIFKWYGGDFADVGVFKRLTAARLLPVISAYLDPEVVQQVQDQPLRLAYMDYDWALNAMQENEVSVRAATSVSASVSTSARVRKKYAIILQAGKATHEGMARAVHALLYAKELYEHGHEVLLVFDGAGTEWAEELSNPASDSALRPLYEELEGTGIVQVVCDFCAGSFNVKDLLAGRPLTLSGEYSGHPSIATLVDEGYQLLVL